MASIQVKGPNPSDSDNYYKYLIWYEDGERQQKYLGPADNKNDKSYTKDEIPRELRDELGSEEESDDINSFDELFSRKEKEERAKTWFYQQDNENKKKFYTEWFMEEHDVREDYDEETDTEIYWYDGTMYPRDEFYGEIVEPWSYDVQKTDEWYNKVIKHFKKDVFGDNSRKSGKLQGIKKAHEKIEDLEFKKEDE